jgi:hypothetical protein
VTNHAKRRAQVGGRHRSWLLAPLLAALLTLLASGKAKAHGGPDFTRTLAAGPYVVDVSLEDYPPIADHRVEVIVTPHASGLRLSGSLGILPGLGTDAIPLRAALAPVRGSSALVGSIHMPVRGAWIIAVHLDGPHGKGEASFDIVVSAPGAIPIWLGWAIGLLPLYGFIWLVWNQFWYRRALLKAAGAA